MMSPYPTAMQVAEQEILHLRAHVKSAIDETHKVYRQLAAAELDARLAWQRYEMANKSHMAARAQLAEANAQLTKLKHDTQKPE